MKTPTCLTLRVVLVAIVSSLVPASSTAATSTASDQSKTHSLFVGADLAIERDQAYCRVNDISGSSFVIARRGSPEFVPSNRGSLNLKVEQSMKVATKSATVSKLKVNRHYSPANDPMRRRTVMQLHMDAIGQERLSNAKLGLLKAHMFPGSGLQSAVVGAQHAYAAELLSMSSEIRGAGFFTRVGQDLADEEDYDALALKFEVSSEHRLVNPYMVVILRYRGPMDAPGVGRDWIYAKSLQPIDSEPRKIRIEKAGFPFGYVIEDYWIHLYDRGQEVATNLSRKRVELTENEAFQHVLKEYIGSNPGATLPAKPAMGRLPQDFIARLAAGQGQQVYYVKISKEGRVLEGFVDESFETKIEDPYFAAAAKSVLFKPALVNGEPAESITEVNLARLARAAQL